MKYEIPTLEQQRIEQDLYNQDRKRFMEQEQIKKKYSAFIKESKTYLLSEALNYFLQPCLKDANKQMGKLLCESFVTEETAPKLLTHMKGKSVLLALVAEAVEDTHKVVVHGAKDTDPSTFKISKTVTDKFFERLDTLSEPEITDRINKNVCRAIEDYVEANAKDKEKLDKLAEETKDKINNIQARTKEQKEKIEQECVQMYKRQVNDIKRRKGYRRINLFEEMMNLATQNTLGDKSMLESFTGEDGKLNVPAIRRNVTTMYTFLEMVNVLELKMINEGYVKKVLKDME